MAFMPSNVWHCAKLNVYKTVLVPSLLVFSIPIFAQNIKTLEGKRKELQQKIEQTTQKLTQTQQSKTAVLDKYETLQDQIEIREQLLDNLQNEISNSDVVVERTEDIINSLNADIADLRVEYGKTLRSSYKQYQQKQNSWWFVLASSNFSEAYQRWQYFKQYDKFRKHQAELILGTQKSLQAKIALIEQKKKEKTQLSATVEEQKEKLGSERKKKQELLETLKSEENQLTKTLQKQEKSNARLNESIKSLIVAEENAKRRAAEAAARKKQADLANTMTKKSIVVKEPKEKKKQEETLTLSDSPENLSLSSDFRANKGKLPLPVLSGKVVRKFGRQPHPTVQGVEITNNGIDLRTDENGEVKAIFSGTVVGVKAIAGFNNVLIVKHGSYYTVYSNLGEVYVKKGDALATRQAVGRVGNNAEGQPDLHFEIWLEKTYLDPLKWVK